LEQRGIVKELTSFGDRFLQYRVKKGATNEYKLGFKNRTTNRVHTIYKQCFTTTGRLSSGDSDNGYYNSQQIPAVPRYREAFTLSQKEIEDDWWITSCDLTGAETMFMCAFAKDEQLYKWAVEEDDVHSPLATACWRAIWEYRVRKRRSLLVKSLVEDKQGNYPVIELTPDIVINKKVNEPYRRYFKNNTFAMVYQAKAQTVGKTLNIPVDEAQIVINVTKSLLPKTFAMVEEAIAFALANKYLVFNTRTNSRKYFFSGNVEAIRGEAANCRIQGSQADAVKEAMMNIDIEFRDRNIKHCQLLQVHDELVIKHQGKEYYKDIQRIMADTATLYLEGFTTMKAEASVGWNWIK
jgi:DNA polymerase-1